MNEEYKKGDEVVDLVINESGMISNIRYDDLGRPIYTIRLANEKVTPDGLVYARREEIRKVDKDGKK